QRSPPPQCRASDARCPVDYLHEQGLDLPEQASAESGRLPPVAMIADFGVLIAWPGIQADRNR
ncbi:MAG TPA: hypothetical protein PKW99_15680, partial [Thauera sp.]|nr:hypothetical protein [Thauera sp.]